MQLKRAFVVPREGFAVVRVDNKEKSWYKIVLQDNSVKILDFSPRASLTELFIGPQLNIRDGKLYYGYRQLTDVIRISGRGLTLDMVVGVFNSLSKIENELNVIQDIKNIVKSLPENWQAKCSVDFSPIDQMEKIVKLISEL
jgi:hypothetical protein